MKKILIISKWVKTKCSLISIIASIQCSNSFCSWFKNIQSTNWQTMRFKPPPANSPIGWRVEFRPTEVKSFLQLSVHVIQDIRTHEQTQLFTWSKLTRCHLVLSLSGAIDGFWECCICDICGFDNSCHPVVQPQSPDSSLQSGWKFSCCPETRRRKKGEVLLQGSTENL